MTQPIYAIGDIHGQIQELERVLQLIERDGGPGAQVVFLGDYVDRGPESRGVIDTLIAGQNAGCNWVMLRGNHDRYLSRFLDDALVRDDCSSSGLHWFNPRLGGDKTLLSYGVTAAEDMPAGTVHAHALASVPQSHRAFLAGLLNIHITEHLVFAHAGIVPGVPHEQQKEDDLIWIREPFLSDPRDHGQLVVHGHTALDTAEHYGNRVNLDGGAGYFRPLCAAVFEGRECSLLTPTGRSPLAPSAS